MEHNFCYFYDYSIITYLYIFVYELFSKLGCFNFISHKYISNNLSFTNFEQAKGTSVSKEGRAPLTRN